MSRGPLATMADRSWLAATDDTPDDIAEAVGPESVYKLGFLNGLQSVLVEAETNRDQLAGALREAGELLSERTGR